MFVIQMHNKLARSFVRKSGGFNDFVRNPEDATKFYTREAAMNARPGHHRDMGGDGPVGTVVTLAAAEQVYIDYARARDRRLS